MIRTTLLFQLTQRYQKRFIKYLGNNLSDTLLATDLYLFIDGSSQQT